MRNLSDGSRDDAEFSKTAEMIPPWQELGLDSEEELLPIAESLGRPYLLGRDELNRAWQERRKELLRHEEGPTSFRE